MTDVALHQPSTRGAVGAFGAVTLWGLGNVLIAWIPMNGLALGTYRLALGTLIYLVFLYSRGGRLSLRVIRAGWIGGFAFGLDIATFFLAVQNTTVAIAVTLSALQPIVIAAAAAVMFGEKVQPRHVVGTLVALPAVGLVAFGNSASGGQSTFGNVMAVLALFAWAAYFIASKKARETLNTMEYMTVLNLVGFLTVLVLGLGTGVLFSPEGTLDVERALLVCAVVALPGTGHIIMNWAHAHTTLMTTSLATLAMPVISTVAAVIFLGQEISGLQVLGIAMVLVTLGFVVVGDSREMRRQPLAEGVPDLPV